MGGRLLGSLERQPKRTSWLGSPSKGLLGTPEHRFKDHRKNKKHYKGLNIASKQSLTGNMRSKRKRATDDLKWFLGAGKKRMRTC